MATVPSAPRVGMAVSYFPGAGAGYGGRAFPALIGAVDNAGNVLRLVVFHDDGSSILVLSPAANGNSGTPGWAYVDLS